MSDMQPFKGCFIYLHDMDERTKPVMIRDYQKPSTNSSGKWPQLRNNADGKSPFLEDTLPRRSTAPNPRPTKQVKPRTRASTATVGVLKKNVLVDNPNPPTVAEMKPVVKRGGSTDQLPMYGSAQASIRKIPRFVQGEPVASGVQRSNITSAVRSQIVSSTAVAPGGKAGSTRELNALKRKVLENQARQDARAPKRKLLNDIVEEEEVERRECRKKRVVEKESKPGYCENCHDKFDDFDEVSHLAPNMGVLLMVR
jgi:regulatory subunit for Cdc7p protein kinase